MSNEESSQDQPRSLRNPSIRRRRLEMLTLPHIAPLTSYVHQLRDRGIGEVPYFDPMDGGINAKVLFLYEKPGPMTSSDPGSKRAGSGFISRNNDDPTAEATFHFMEKAGIPRKITVTWNVIPGWNGTIKVTSQELRQGVDCVTELITLLPDLRAVIFVGKNAAKAKPLLEGKGLHLSSSDHPSPRVRALFRSRWENIPYVWARAIDGSNPQQP